MRVKSWIGDYEEASSLKASIDTMGGFFQDGMRWKDYEAKWTPEELVYIQALRNEIIENNIRFGGDFHQYSDEGVPQFEDDTVALFSYRGWGDLMAATWSEHENFDYCYMDFYMNCTMKKSAQ